MNKWRKGLANQLGTCIAVNPKSHPSKHPNCQVEHILHILYGPQTHLLTFLEGLRSVQNLPLQYIKEELQAGRLHKSLSLFF